MNLNSIFNKYSTKEQEIGIWIDGKKIYRKVIPFQNVEMEVNNMDGIVYSVGYINIQSLNIETAIDLRGFYGLCPIPYTSVSKNFIFEIGASHETIYYKFGPAIPKNMSCFVIIEYTKK